MHVGRTWPLALFLVSALLTPGPKVSAALRLSAETAEQDAELFRKGRGSSQVDELFGKAVAAGREALDYDDFDYAELQASSAATLQGADDAAGDLAQGGDPGKLEGDDDGLDSLLKDFLDTGKEPPAASPPKKEKTAVPDSGDGKAPAKTPPPDDLERIRKDLGRAVDDSTPPDTGKAAPGKAAAMPRRKVVKAPGKEELKSDGGASSRGDPICSGWAPNTGPLRGMGAMCSRWNNSKSPWCFIDLANASMLDFVKPYKSIPGKFFGPCTQEADDGANGNNTMEAAQELDKKLEDLQQLKTMVRQKKIELAQKEEERQKAQQVQEAVQKAEQVHVQKATAEAKNLEAKVQDRAKKMPALDIAAKNELGKLQAVMERAEEEMNKVRERMKGYKDDARKDALEVAAARAKVIDIMNRTRLAAMEATDRRRDAEENVADAQQELQEAQQLLDAMQSAVEELEKTAGIRRTMAADGKEEGKASAEGKRRAQEKANKEFVDSLFKQIADSTKEDSGGGDAKNDALADSVDPLAGPGDAGGDDDSSLSLALAGLSPPPGLKAPATPLNVPSSPGKAPLASVPVPRPPNVVPVSVTTTSPADATAAPEASTTDGGQPPSGPVPDPPESVAAALGEQGPPLEEGLVLPENGTDALLEALQEVLSQQQQPPGG
eukprot:TRINITY_DN10946_c0_g1_i2.p1 TRINITY_DN10946_c0_g1~~TRINITY_DN10946_c0_g1_i2.p1  ORF type:complete len:664 (+),score=240.10 TRINITY_DN10946_c0_g1_i2:133-2124(+)